jgi:5'(3')-deoxyribonucleotidase
MEETHGKMKTFFESEFFLRGIPVVDGALKAMRRLKKYFELHVVVCARAVCHACAYNRVCA